MWEQLRELLEQPWLPVSRAGVVAWAMFYLLFLMYAWGGPDFLFVDNAHLIVHEGGHLLFAFFGDRMSLWGGSLLQWFVPFALAAGFFFKRQIYGTAFCLFFAFEGLLYSSHYIADARAQNLPLVTVGDPENGGHDWFNILAPIGYLPYDTRIGAWVKALAWLGMLLTLLWFTWRGWQVSAGEKARAIGAS